MGKKIINESFTPQEWLIPRGIRNKTLISRDSRELFFIDCLNDLRRCAQIPTSYNLIRSSVLLRMLLIESGISVINKNYQLKFSLLANPKNLGGSAFKSEMKDIWNTMKPMQNKLPAISHLSLTEGELEEHTIEKFLSKICISFAIYQGEEFNFSISNVIKLIANKHGAAHLEYSFDSTAIDSFHLDDYNPFSMNDGNKFLLIIREIIIIMLEALKPLANKVVEHLTLFNSSTIEAKGTSEVIMYTKEEYEKKFGKIDPR